MQPTSDLWLQSVSPVWEQTPSINFLSSNSGQTRVGDELSWVQTHKRVIEVTDTQSDFPAVLKMCNDDNQICVTKKLLHLRQTMSTFVFQKQIASLFNLKDFFFN